MWFIAAVAVASVGIGLYAAAALMWDRRAQVVAWWDRRAVRTAGGATPVATNGVRNLYLAVALCVVLGTLMLIGCCAGPFVL